MNSFNGIGRLGMDPEIRDVGGHKKLGLRIAFDRHVKVNGRWEKKAVWMSTSAWDKDAENLAGMLRKGDQVGVTGEIDIQEWTTKDGEKRTSTHIERSRIHLIGGKREGGASRGDFGSAKGNDDWPADDFGDDEIPF